MARVAESGKNFLMIQQGRYGLCDTVLGTQSTNYEDRPVYHVVETLMI